MKTTKTELQNSFELLASITGFETTHEGAEKEGHEFYLDLDYNSTYGGYRLDKVKVSNGATYGAFGYSSIEPRLSIQEMNVRIRGILAGIEYAENNL